MRKKFSTLTLCITVVLINTVIAERTRAASVETVGDLTVSGVLDNSTGSGIKFPDGNIQTSACSGCANGILTIDLGGTGASTASAALANLGGVNKTGDTMTGNLSVPTLHLSGNLNLPTTTTTSGIIKSGGYNFIHSYGTNSFFAGLGAGNTTMTGVEGNTGVGQSVLEANVTGIANTGLGSRTLWKNSTGGGNSALGYAALYSNTSGSNNTAVGFGALYTNSSGYDNTAVGSGALHDSTGLDNTAVGYNSLSKNTGNNNVACGASALRDNTSGTGNTALGYYAGQTFTTENANKTGTYNTFIGFNSGPGSATQFTNATAIGAQAKVNSSNSLVLGGTGVSAVKVGIGTATPTETLDVVGNVRLNKKDIYLRDGTDVNHGLGWYGEAGKQFEGKTIDGPVLYGYTDGALGTTAGPGQKTIMTWHWSSGSDFYGVVRFHDLSGGTTRTACLDDYNTLSACSSDARMKKDVITLSENMDVLDALAKLRGVMFTWDRTNEKAAGMESRRDMGMIAQEVETVFPEIVHTENDGYKSMDYPKLVAFLVEVNKAQQIQLNARKEDMDRLSRTVEELAARLSALEGRR